MKRFGYTRKSFGYLTLLTLFALTACNQTQTEQAQSQQGASALGEQTLEVWNKGNLALINELYAPEFVRHNVPLAEDIEGPEAFKEYVTSVRTAYPDFAVQVDNEIAMNDLRILQWTVTGTNTGPGPELPATGKPINVSGASIIRYANGKLVEEWVYWNHATLLTQLGYTLTPPEVASSDQN